MKRLSRYLKPRASEFDRREITDKTSNSGGSLFVLLRNATGPRRALPFSRGTNSFEVFGGKVASFERIMGIL